MASLSNTVPDPAPAPMQPITNPDAPLPPTGNTHPDVTHVAADAQILAPEALSTAALGHTAPDDAAQFVGPTKGPNPMYKATSTAPFMNVFQPDVSTFFPNSNVLFYILYIMDTQMVQTHRWTQSSVSWHPIVSRIYFSVLFYIQILRCMEAADILHLEGLKFLHEFMDAYPLHTLAVPGPLVVFFESLAVSLPTADFFGSVLPRIPDVPTTAQSNSYVLVDNIKYIFPDLPHLIEQANLLISDNNYVFRRTLGNKTLRSAANAPASPQADIDIWNTISGNPALRYPIQVTAALRQNFTDNGSFLNLPSALANGTAATTLNWSEFLFFSNGNDVNWFGRVAGLMSSYSRYFTYQKSLNDCSPTSSSVGQIRSYLITAIPASTASTTGHYADLASINALVPRFPFTVKNTHSNLGISEADEQAALLTQINLVDPSSPAQFGTVNTTLVGPYWTVTPSMRTSPTVDPTPSIENIIPSRMHNAAPENV